MSNIPPRCRLLGTARRCWGPAHAVKSSQQQHRALWVFSNQKGPSIKAELFWILTMPTEIWSRIKHGLCGPLQCWGSKRNFKILWALAFRLGGRLGGRSSSFWENVSRSHKEIWLGLRLTSSGASTHLLTFRWPENPLNPQVAQTNILYFILTPRHPQQSAFFFKGKRKVLKIGKCKQHQCLQWKLFLRLLILL